MLAEKLYKKALSLTFKYAHAAVKISFVFFITLEIKQEKSIANLATQYRNFYVRSLKKASIDI